MIKKEDTQSIQARVPRMMLGTAQFGMPYGIANQKGQPSKNEVYKIIKHAHESGYNQYDTASAYGESEKTLGLIFNDLKITSSVFVSTKIKPLNKEVRESSKKSKNAIIKSLDYSLKRLKINCINNVLFHNEEDALHIEVLEKQKELGKCKKIGVSYTKYSKTLSDLILNDKIEVLQIPINIMDQRLYDKKILNYCTKKNIQIYIRSIFLQGILTMENNKIPSNLKGLKPLHLIYSNIAKKSGFSLKEIALRAMFNLGFSNLVIGNESLEQLKENISLFKKGPLPNQLIKTLKDQHLEIKPCWLTPWLWPSSA